MPYLNPLEVPNTDLAEFCSVCICFPDYPEYRAALLGSLNYLAQWTAWERDNAHSASKSAALWRVANEATKECWDMPCGGSSLPPVINVTVNNSCSGGGGGEATAYCVDDDGVITINPPPIGDIPIYPPENLPPGVDEYPAPVTPGVGDPPPEWPTWEAFDVDACKAANALVEMQYQFWRRTSDFFSQDVFTFAAYFVLLWNLFAGRGWTLLFDRSLSLKIADIVGRLSFLGAIGAYTGGIAGDIEDNRQELVCELYTTRGNYSDWVNLLAANVSGFAARYLQAGVEFDMVQELIAFTLPPVGSVWAMLGGLTMPEVNYVSCEDCVAEPTGLWAKDWTPTGGTFVHSYDGITFQQINYSTGVPIVFGETWYMRSGIFYVSTTEAYNDTPANAVIRVTNPSPTPFTVSVTNASGLQTDTQVLAEFDSHDFAGCYLTFSPTQEYTDFIDVMIVNQIL